MFFPPSLSGMLVSRHYCAKTAIGFSFGLHFPFFIFDASTCGSTAH
jgi:hypothetical protein